MIPEYRSLLFYKSLSSLDLNSFVENSGYANCKSPNPNIGPSSLVHGKSLQRNTAHG